MAYQWRRNNGAQYVENNENNAMAKKSIMAKAGVINNENGV